MVIRPARSIYGKKDHLEAAESIAISTASKTSNMEVDVVPGVSIA
jgi:hypothetical protein